MSDHVAWLYQRYLRHGRLFHAHIDPTWRCPLRCRHCYLGGDAPKELSLADLVDVLEQLADMGVMSLLFSGGEVFTRPDFLDIVGEARRRGFMVLVKTSGTLCRPEDCDTLAKLGVRTVHVSLYSHRRLVHDEVTRLPGSFDRSLATILRLQALGVRVEAVVTLLQGFEEDFSTVRSGLLAQGIRTVAINELKDIGCFEGYPLDGLWVGESSRQEQWETAFGDRPPRREVRADEPVCLAGRLSLYVGPDGNVRPCLEWPETLGNVRDERLADLWRDPPSLRPLRSLTWGTSTGCMECADRPWCYACPARSLRETGDPARPAPSICQRTALWRRLDPDSGEGDR
ncbi:MAG: radical SAM protein [Pseudomonadota bacterium]